MAASLGASSSSGPMLRALPSEAYEIVEWGEVTVNLDYHVEHEKLW